jgi:hypothetical protein
VTSLPGAFVGGSAPGTLGTAVLAGLEGHFMKVFLVGPQPGADGKPVPLDLLTRRVLENYLFQQDDGPPGLLYLAIRAARRALRDNPDDPQTYLLLGEAYLRLARNTRERFWGTQMSHLTRLREVQATAALHEALRLQPDLIQAHHSLANLFQSHGLKDLTLKHRKEELRLSRPRGRLPGESEADARKRLDALAEAIRALEADVDKERNVYETNAANLKVLDRAEDAARRGLANKALEVLLAQPDVAAAAGAKGVHLEMNLLLTVGRVREVRDWVTDDHKNTLGHELYEWSQAQVAAACGEYDRADEKLALSSQLELPREGMEQPPSLREAMAMIVGEKLLQKAVAEDNVLRRMQAPVIEQSLNQQIGEIADRLRRQAGAKVMRGLLAVERGDTKKAEGLFREALVLWQSDAAVASGAGIDFSGRTVAQAMLEMLKRRP